MPINADYCRLIPNNAHPNIIIDFICITSEFGHYIRSVKHYYSERGIIANLFEQLELMISWKWFDVKTRLRQG